MTGSALTQSAFDSSYATPTGAVVGAGQMSPEAADHFIDSLFDLTSLRKSAQIIKMGAPERRISKFNVGKRILRPGTSGVAPSYFAQAGVDELLLQARLMKATVKINDEEIEDNLAGTDLTAYVMAKIQAQVANEVEYASLMGQKTGLVGSPVYVDHQMDGWYYLAKQGGHVIAGDALADGAASANTRTFTKTKLSKAAKAIPSKWKTTAIDFQHFVSPNVYQDFTDSLANRATPGGDRAFAANGYENNLPTDYRSTLGYAGYPLFTVPQLPENLFYDKQSSQASTTVSSGGAAGANTFVVASATGFSVGDGIIVGDPTTPNAERATITGIAGTTFTVSCPDTADGNFAYGHSGAAVKNGTLDRTFMLTTYPKNFVIGVLRDVRVEPTRWGPESATYYTLSLRMDTQLEWADACAIVDNMAVA